MLKEEDDSLINKVYIRIMIDNDDDSYTTKKFAKLEQIKLKLNNDNDTSIESSESHPSILQTGFVLNESVYLTLKPEVHLNTPQTTDKL